MAIITIFPKKSEEKDQSESFNVTIEGGHGTLERGPRKPRLRNNDLHSSQLMKLVGTNFCLEMMSESKTYILLNFTCFYFLLTMFNYVVTVLFMKIVRK